MSLAAYLDRSRAVPLVIAVTVLGIFLPALIVGYAFSDDYPDLALATGAGPDPWFGSSLVATSTGEGRPLAGVLLKLLFSAAGTIDNLRFVRLVAVVAILALALLLHFALVRSGLSSGVAGLVAVFVCTMPPFLVMGSWAVLVNGPCAALLAACASLLAIAALDAPRDLVLDRIVGSAAALFASLLLYPPGAMFFWVFLAAALIGAGRQPRRVGSVVRVHARVALIALPLAFLVGEIASRSVAVPARFRDRSALVHDVFGKIRWFFSDRLYKSLNLFDLTPSIWLAVVVGLLGAAGLVLLLRREKLSLPRYLALAAVLVPLTFLPNLVTSENNSLNFRTEIALTSLIALYVCLGALGIWLTLRDWLQPRVDAATVVLLGRLAFVFAFAVVGASAFVGAKNVTTLVVNPQSTELRILRRDVASLPVGAQRIGYTQIDWTQGLTPYYSDELGVPSAARPWTPDAAIKLILREQGRWRPGQPEPAVDVFSPGTTQFPAGEPIIDLRGLAQLR